MKNKLISIVGMGFILATLLTFTGGCKKSDDTIQYQLSVVLSQGVIGTPSGGSYPYDIGDTVDYSYSLEDGFGGLKVLLDGTEVEPSGTFTIEGDHVLEVRAFEGDGEFLFSVSHGTGIEGTPEAGDYTYNQGDQVPYAFTLKDGYTNIVVTLDGVEIPAEGTVTVSDDHLLYAFAEKEYDIRGSWVLSETYLDGSSFRVSVTFEGEIRNGTVTDTDGGTGTYTVDGNDVSFTLVFPDVSYEYSGKFIDVQTMQGGSRRYSTPEIYSSGSWSASMQGGETQSAGSSKGKGDR